MLRSVTAPALQRTTPRRGGALRCVRGTHPRPFALLSGSLLHPHLVVVEGGAADGCDFLGPGQHVDAAATDMGLVGLNRFGDQYAAVC